MKAIYPIVVSIQTPDGSGEAIKGASEAAWNVSIPSGDFRFYGNRPEMVREVRGRLNKEYPNGIFSVGKPSP
jgi:hypothetical protein